MGEWLGCRRGITFSVLACPLGYAKWISGNPRIGDIPFCFGDDSLESLAGQLHDIAKEIERLTDFLRLSPKFLDQLSKETPSDAS